MPMLPQDLIDDMNRPATRRQLAVLRNVLRLLDIDPDQVEFRENPLTYLTAKSIIQSYKWEVYRRGQYFQMHSEWKETMYLTLNPRTHAEMAAVYVGITRLFKKEA